VVVSELLQSVLEAALRLSGFYVRIWLLKGLAQFYLDWFYDCPFQVFEETGFDISDIIEENQYIELTVNEQCTRLYIIPGVERSTKFCPRTRNEIRAVEWFPLADLPASKKDTTSKVKYNLGPNNFFMVVPFVK